MRTRVVVALRRVGLAVLLWGLGQAPCLAESLTGRCVAVGDGDTVTVAVGPRRERIRLIGIDAPEKQQAPWGERARAFTARLVLDQEVRVETDVEPRDRYGRMLGYVYVGDTFVNREVIRSGHAVLLTYPPNVRHVEAFTAAQAEARSRGLGVWDPKEPLTEEPRAFRRHSRERAGGYTRMEGARVSGPSAGTSAAASSGSADGQVRYNARRNLFHPPGCGHDCSSCLPMARADAEAKGARPCRSR